MKTIIKFQIKNKFGKVELEKKFYLQEISKNEKENKKKNLNKCVLNVRKKLRWLFHFYEIRIPLFLIFLLIVYLILAKVMKMFQKKLKFN